MREFDRRNSPDLYGQFHLNYENTGVSLLKTQKLAKAVGFLWRRPPSVVFFDRHYVLKTPGIDNIKFKGGYKKVNLDFVKDLKNVGWTGYLISNGFEVREDPVANELSPNVFSPGQPWNWRPSNFKKDPICVQRVVGRILENGDLEKINKNGLYGIGDMWTDFESFKMQKEMLEERTGRRVMSTFIKLPDPPYANWPKAGEWYG
jgi:hypothetical protein